MPTASLRRPVDAPQQQHQRSRLRETRHAPLKIAAILKVLADHGLDLAAALHGTGLTLAQLAQPDTLTSIAQLLKVGCQAMAQAPEAALGLETGLRMHASSYGMYGYALLCGSTLRQGFDLAVRYHALATPVLAITWQQRASHAAWVFPGHDDVPELGLDADQYRFFLEMQYAQHVTLTYDGMGDWCHPSRVLFSLPRPAHVARLQEIFQCPVAFDQPVNELHYPTDWLERTPSQANPLAAAQMSRACARLVEQLQWRAGISRRVYDELTHTPGRFPDIDAIADTLGMTARTLRRKLDAEGSSYSQLLDSVRYALALDYLAAPLLSIEDIATALGFSDAAGFRQAFKRWTGGDTPTRFRR